MTVFRGYLKGALRQRAVIILYLVIFLGLGTVMTWSMEKEPDDTYKAQKLSMAVIDHDHSEISQGLLHYLTQTQDVKNLADDASVLQEELYYGNVAYVMVIPENFGHTFLASAEAGALPDARNLLQGTGRPGSTQSYYASELTNCYLSGLALYLKAGLTPADAVTHMQKQLEAVSDADSSVTLAEGSSSMSRVAGTFRYLAYVLTALSCYVIGFVVLDYQQTDLRRRIAVSATPFAMRMLQMLLAFIVIGAVFFVASFVMVGIMNPREIFEEPNLTYYALNVLAMVLVALAIAFLVVHLAGTANGVNGLANMIALGMSFFCGVFIPDSMLSAPVRRIAKYFPVYWYEQNNTILGTHTVLTATLKERFLSGILWQLLVAVVVFAAAMLLKKVKDRQ